MPKKRRHPFFYPLSDAMNAEEGDVLCCTCGRAIGMHSDCRFSSDGHHHIDCAEDFHKGKRSCENCPTYRRCTFDGKAKRNE